MGITFNGQVIINGNVEMYDNGSMKISANQIQVNISELKNFIEENLKYSSNKQDYLEAAKTIQTSQDKNIMKTALSKLRNIGRELGKNVLITGLSNIAIETFKELSKSL